MIKRVIGVALIAVIGAACTEKGGDNPAKPEPSNGEKHYVKSIDIYYDDTSASDVVSPGESIVFELDDKNRITNIKGVEYNDANEVVDTYADIKFKYSDDSRSLIITTTMDDMDFAAVCDLNDRGAITTARWQSPEELCGLVEDFVYNDKGELVTYTLSMGNMVEMSFDYEWKDGNIVKIISEDIEVNDVCTYTDEPNPYNIDMFYAYAWNMPMLAEVILIHDGLLGNTNRSMLKSYSTNLYGEEINEVIDHKFKDGLVDYTIYDDTIFKYRCF